MAVKKILIVTPIFPFPPVGAEQSDRVSGMRQLKRLGYDVAVIVKSASWQSPEQVKEAGRQEGIEILPVPYKYGSKELSFREKINKLFLKMKNPLLLDGAALEYDEPEIRFVVERKIAFWKPDVVWFEYTYLWPLYNLARKANIPVITRSINFEPVHFLQEDGYSLLNIIKSLPKITSEFLTVWKSDHIFAITPKEKRIYRMLGAKSVSVLPLRGLPDCLRDRIMADKAALNVFFMGSTYTVSHNRRALEMVVKQIAPLAAKKYPGRFSFHILGAKLPKDIEPLLCGAQYQGYVPDLEKFLENMDAALIPSLFGAGMQQKIFESLCRGIPTITSARGLAGYPFRDGEHLLLADAAEDFVDNLVKMLDFDLRRKLSANASQLCGKLFSWSTLDRVVLDILRSL